MTETQTYDIISATVWAVLLASGPVLGVALAIGLVIAFFQALTQIQEMTLTFVPKVGLMLIVFWVTMSFMTTALSDFYLGQIIPLIAGG